MEWLIIGILALLGLAIVLTTLSRLKPTETAVWYPKIARIRIQDIPCRICGRGLGQNDLVVWFQRRDDRTMPAHAECAVLIRDDCGCVYRLDGTAPPDDWQITEGYVLLTQEEWEAWEKSDEVSVPRRVC